jgi:hypothetical protein
MAAKTDPAPGVVHIGPGDDNKALCGADIGGWVIGAYVMCTDCEALDETDDEEPVSHFGHLRSKGSPFRGG